ncbi:hypothetical protein L210DRAFT_3389378 [Boletus edulis BED1]|uniref:Uncharacterized protein n=1 Tax=Boletus edulis BED1 TaxID=1328754 RepID=A0AAD4C522_BOLED|nr:hypothetical protein L210DRAFT_3389378 [Boletus edulis BED1]
MSNSWRALAKMARDRIVASDPEDLGRILDLWSLRLSSLARLRLTNQASAECTNLFAVLNAVHATSIPGMHELVHPFELTMFHARVHYWSGDPLGYVDALSRILRRCKERAREEGRIGPDDVLAAAEANLSMWLERIARACLILASQMIEMNDYQAAINLLTPLCTNRAAPAFQPTPTPELHSALARVYLLSGNLQKAEEHFSIAVSAAANSANGTDVIAMNTALLAAASGDWTRAEEALSEMVAKDPGNFTAINNLAVTLLYQGRIKEGIDLLEAALKMSPSSVVVTEPFLFNLSTLYELRSTAAIDKKRGLLIEVAKWSGDGLKTSCLKMPAS